MKDFEITVLRLGHRPERDIRISTHVALVARAMGAKSIILPERDERVERAVQGVNTKFGGKFSVLTETNWKKLIQSWEGSVIHLTMYGEPVDRVIERIKPGHILVIVGAEKVPRVVYELADYNIAVTNQPHSEVASLAIFLDRITRSKWTKRCFGGPRIIVPSPDSKIVIDITKGYLRDEDCKKILSNAGCEEGTIEHAEFVARLAEKVASMCGADVDLVRTAAMLHDIGRSRSPGPEHGYLGGTMLREMCFPDIIASIVEKHVGGGLSSEEAKAIGIPKRDFIPRTLEEKIVCITDKMVDFNKKVPIRREIERLEREDLNQAGIRVRKLYEEISRKCGVDLDSVNP